MTIMNLSEQLTLHLGRCQVKSKDGWQCTKWESHKGKTHTALAPSGWHPDYAIDIMGISNFINRSFIEERHKLYGTL